MSDPESPPAGPAAGEEALAADGEPAHDTQPVAASGLVEVGASDVASGQALAAQVVRWHNRHPLARRIVASDVGLFGRVVLPFSAAEGQTPRLPLFSAAGLIPGASQRALAAFAGRHGTIDPPGPTDWPERRIPAEVSPPGSPEPKWLNVLTVAIRKPGASGDSVRVLAAPAAGAAALAVLGRRQWSRARLAGAAALLVALLVGIAAAVGFARHGAAAGPTGDPAAAQPASAEPTPASASASAGSKPSLGASAALNPAQAASSAAASAGLASASLTSASAVAGVSSTAPASEPASHGTMGSGAAAKVARARSGAGSALHVEKAAANTLPTVAKAASAPASGPPTPGETSARKPVPASAPAAAASEERQTVDLPSRQIVPVRPHRRPLHALPEGATAPGQVHFALASAPMPNQVDARSQQRRLRAALGPDGAAMKIDLMSTPRGQVITVWPLPSRAAAERLARELARQGVPMSPIEF